MQSGIVPGADGQSANILKAYPERAAVEGIGGGEPRSDGVTNSIYFVVIR